MHDAWSYRCHIWICSSYSYKVLFETLWNRKIIKLNYTNKIKANSVDTWTKSRQNLNFFNVKFFLGSKKAQRTDARRTIKLYGAEKLAKLRQAFPNDRFWDTLPGQWRSEEIKGSSLPCILEFARVLVLKGAVWCFCRETFV